VKHGADDESEELILLLNFYKFEYENLALPLNRYFVFYTLLFVHFLYLNVGERDYKFCH
jgi:hypothetical protein